MQPEWQKLSEQVATIVFNPEHPVAMKFKIFCSELHGKCQEFKKSGNNSNNLESTSNLYGDKSDATNNHDFGAYVGCFPRFSFFKAQGQRSNSRSASYESLQQTDFSANSYQEELKQIKDMISDHFESTTDLLQQALSKHSAGNEDHTHFRNKLRVSYIEHCFHDKEISKDILGSFKSSLECIYVHATQNRCKYLKIHIERLQKHSIHVLLHFLESNNNLSINDEDECWLKIFDQRKPTCEPISQVSNSSAEDKTLCHENSDNLRSETTTNQLGINSDDDAKSLSSVVDEWDLKAMPIRESFKKRTLSMYSTYFSDATNEDSTSSSQEKGEMETFEKCFGLALRHVKDVLKADSPLKKLKIGHLLYVFLCACGNPYLLMTFVIKLDNRLQLPLVHCGLPKCTSLFKYRCKHTILLKKY